MLMGAHFLVVKRYFFSGWQENICKGMKDKLEGWMRDNLEVDERYFGGG